MQVITRLSTPSFSLVDTTTLCEWLRIDPTLDIATIGMLLASATDYLEGQTGLVLAAADYQVQAPAMCPYIPLALQPLNSVESVVAQNSDGTTQALVMGTDYVVNTLTACPNIMVLNVPPLVLSYTIALNAGYTSEAMVPAALQQAAAVLVAAGYDNRSALPPQTIQTVANLITRYRMVGI